jgi:hypothetical protein
VAPRSNKMTVHVSSARHTQTMTIRASGHMGKVSLVIPPTQQTGQTLSTASDPKTYWNAVLVLAQAMVLSM